MSSVHCVDCAGSRPGKSCVGMPGGRLPRVDWRELGARKGERLGWYAAIVILIHYTTTHTYIKFSHTNELFSSLYFLFGGASEPANSIWSPIKLT